MIKYFVFLVSFLLTSISIAAIPKWSVDLEHSQDLVEFHATAHPSALRIVGKGSQMRGKFFVQGSQITGEALFDLDSLDTGIGLRTKHMKEKYLEIKKFRQAKFVLTEMNIPSDSKSIDHVPFSGKLTLHGIERPVSGFAKLEKNGNSVNVSAEFEIKITDYGIQVPQFAGITVSNQVQILISVSGQTEARYPT